MNGILQDTMDDRIHNSLMLGFPISDDVCHIGINQIEGQNVLLFLVLVMLLMVMVVVALKNRDFKKEII